VSRHAGRHRCQQATLFPGSDWVHRIKHDGYRLMARRDPVGVRLLTKRGNDWSPRASR
jgi:ATP-dependent DNA ligase